MSKKPLVSIIIPFYNEEKYLKRCIESAINQSHDRIEIILVNDGSTDSSESIAERYTAIPFVTLISTGNESLGSARNKGLSAASGEYIVFLDSDDWLEPVMVEQMLKILLHYNADIALCKFRMVDELNQPLFEGGWKLDRTVISNTEAIHAMYHHQITFTAWAKLFRTEIIKKIQFPEKLLFEDRPFILETFIHSTVICYTEEILLNILRRDGSLSRSITSLKRLNDLTAIYQIEVNLLRKYKQEELLPLIDRHHLIFCLKDSWQRLCSDEKRDPKVQKLRPVFMVSVKEYVKTLGPRRKMLGIKDRIHLLILQLPALLGWSAARITANLIYHAKSS